jgi:hypothetical protein
MLEIFDLKLLLFLCFEWLVLFTYLVTFSHSLSNSATASSFESAAVYRATIAPLDHPAIVRTETSETPLRRA